MKKCTHKRTYAEGWADVKIVVSTYERLSLSQNY